MKKDKKAKKNVFQRVLESKKKRTFSISDPIKNPNKYQEVADFVGSQQRILNTKGQHSKLAKNWGRFSKKSHKEVAEPTTESVSGINTSTIKGPILGQYDVEQRANMGAQKQAFKPQQVAIDVDESRKAEAGSKASLEGRRAVNSARLKPAKEQSETNFCLEGKDSADANIKNDASYLGHHTPNEGAVGNADMGDFSVVAEVLVLAGNFEVPIPYINAKIDRQKTSQNGDVQLSANASMQGSIVNLSGSDELLKADGNEQKAPYSKLSKKMVKIRSKTADIIMDSNTLKKRNDES